MLTPSSPSRAEALLREAIDLEAEELYLQAEGERTKVRYRVMGRIVQKLDGFMPDAHNVFAELRALITQEDFADENEGMGYFSFLVQERAYWIRVYWFREQEEDAVVISILEPRLGFDDLGLSERNATILDELIAHPSGVVIGCGTERSGHGTTLNALLERLVQSGKRVVFLTDETNPRLEGVTQIEVVREGFAEQVELLAGHFDVFAIGNLDSAEKVHSAFALAKEGHLVLGLIYSFPVTTALSLFRSNGISPEELNNYFLGGWSQCLVQRASGHGRIGLFNCLSREETRSYILEGEGTDSAYEEGKRALWRDAEEKIAQGLIPPEEARDLIFPFKDL